MTKSIDDSRDNMDWIRVVRDESKAKGEGASRDPKRDKKPEQAR